MMLRFRPFKSREEENKASDLIGTIDQGEKWIFDGAEGSKDFGGFIDRLYFSSNETFGTYCACIFNENLRIQIGFNTDMPEGLASELISLITSAREKVNTNTSIWYVPKNEKLDKFLYNELPWKGTGHKTYEFKALREDFEGVDFVLQENIKIVLFEGKYLNDTCIMLDKSLAHTFDDPCKNIFFNNRNKLGEEWMEKAKTGECSIMLELENNTVIGAYVLKGMEIDIMAIDVNKQGKGLGKQLLLHAIKHILSSYDDVPYLYCIENNINAIKFYKRQGMKITGHSGYLFLRS